MVSRLSDAIKSLLGEPSISAKLNLAGFERAWSDAVGEIVAENSKVVKIFGNKLIVKTSGPAWRNELTMQKHEILIKLNEIQKKVIIKEITFI